MQLARTIVLREQEIEKRSQELAKLRAEFARAMHEPEQGGDQLDLPISEKDEPQETQSIEVATRPALTARPNIARAGTSFASSFAASLVQRVYSALQVEPRAFTASEIANRLEMTDAIDTIRTTLSKLYNRNMIARPFLGQYCALEYEDAVRRAAGAA